MSEVHIDAASDLQRSWLPDARLVRRAALIGERIQKRPQVSFPNQLEGEAELEAFYRFTNNPRVRAGALREGHRKAAWERASSAATVLVLHDTTECKFVGEHTREGLTQVGSKQVFWAHAALAVAEDGPPQTYGMVGLQPYTQDEKLWIRHHPDDTTEQLAVGSLRWLALVDEVVAHPSATQNVVHVMDREGDDYVLLSHLKATEQSFVIRSSHDRHCVGEQRLRGQLGEASIVVERLVDLSARGGKRPPKSKKQHPDRGSRKARLSVRARAVTLERPAAAAPIGTSEMTLNVVEVVEVAPPEGEKPISWYLMSDLPIDTPEDVARIIDIYRRRWLIEEFFKSLKTGCGFLKRQANSLRSLLIVLALLTPVACRLLNLRTLARTSESLSWRLVFDEVELTVLRQLVPRHKLPKNPSIEQVMKAVASLGGHLRSNGTPGWVTLGRGLEKLLDRVEGWRAAMRHLQLGGDFLA